MNSVADVNIVNVKSKLEASFTLALTEIIKQVQPLDAQHGIAVAYSGGLDSSVLLALTARFCQQSKIPLFAFHVHHGLSPNADNWAAHCETQAAKYGATFAKQDVLIEKKGQGIEAAARQLRYRALGHLCEQHRTKLVLTGHHLDDQAETILMQMLRGTGLAGMAGMDQFNYAPKLLKQSDVMLARPLLASSKQDLIEFSNANDIINIEDESNLQTQYTRNALRHLAMPMLEQIAPGYVDRLARMGQHARESQQVLQEIAYEDFHACGSKTSLYVTALQKLSLARIHQVLRYWLNLYQVNMPSTAKLTEIRSQLLESKADAKVTVSHDGIVLHRYANELYIVPEYQSNEASIEEIIFQWQGEKCLHLPSYRGSLHFESSITGIDRYELASMNLCIKPRSGGERIRLASNRPSRSIKSHCQTLRIPFWQRSSLPCIYFNNELLYVAAIGIDAQFLKQEQADLIAITWHPDELIKSVL